MITRLRFLPLLLFVPLLATASPSRVKIASDQEPGRRLILTGRVLGPDGTPRAGVVVYAYHTDARGFYTADGGNGAPRLRGTLVTAADGSYEIDTIKPGAYPSQHIPAHIHFTLRVPGVAEQAEKIWFEGDPLLPPGAASKHAADIVRLRQEQNGVLRGTHDFHLGGGR